MSSLRRRRPSSASSTRQATMTQRPQFQGEYGRTSMPGFNAANFSMSSSAYPFPVFGQSSPGFTPLSQTPGNGHDMMSSNPAQTGQAFAMDHWVTNPEGPWSDKTGVPVQPENFHSNVYSAPIDAVFRESDILSLPSEQGQLFNDSGYGGSRPTYTANSCPSHYGGDSTIDSHTIEGMRNMEVESRSYPPFVLNVEYEGSLHQESSRLQPAHPMTLDCGRCTRTFQTKSDLKKHVQRHEKPFACPHQECQGLRTAFATSNDLKRHRKSKHSECSADDVYYVCYHGDCVNKKSLKKEFRPDNFRYHLRRKHGIEVDSKHGLGSYMHRVSELPQVLQGVGTAMHGLESPSSPMDFPDSSESLSTFPNLDIENTNRDSTEQASQLFRHRETVPYDTRMGLSPTAGVGMASSLTHNVPTQGIMGQFGSVTDDAVSNSVMSSTTAMQRLPSLATVGSVVSSNSEGVEAGTTMTSYTKSEAPMSVGDIEGTTIADLAHLISGPSSSAGAMATGSSDGASTELRRMLRSLPKNLQKSALRELSIQLKRSDVLSQNDSTSTPGVHTAKCPLCNNEYKRPCNLRKHMKRHEKPYGCTHYGCGKPFGSKSDWKRHESSQHSPSEIWVCEESHCQTISTQADVFEAHLRLDHGVRDDLHCREKMETCRLGRHGGARFWCGFCKAIVTIQKRDVNMWTERCDHVVGHLFDKNNLPKRSADEWVYIETLSGERHDGRRSGDATARKRPPSSPSDANPRSRKKAAQKKFYGWECVRGNPSLTAIFDE